MTTASASSFSSSPCPYSSPWVRAWAANDLPLSAPVVWAGQSAAEHSEQRQPSRFVHAAVGDEPSAELRLHAGDAEAVGLVRDARREWHGPRARRPSGSARNLPSLGPGASPPPFHPGRTLEGPNPDGPSGASPHSLSHSDDSSSGCRTLSCATPSSATLDTRSRCATWAPDRFVTRTAATTGASASPASHAVGQRPLRVPFSRLGSGAAGTRRRGAGRPRSTLPAVRLRGIGPPGSREHDPPTSTAELSWVVTAPPPTLSERTNPLGEACVGRQRKNRHLAPQIIARRLGRDGRFRV